MEDTIKYDKIISEYDFFLKKNPKHFIRIKDVDRDKFLVFAPGKEGSYITYQRVQEKHNDFAEYLNDLILSKNLKRAWFYFKSTNGSSSRTVMDPQDIDLSPKLEALKNNTLKTPETMDNEKVNGTGYLNHTVNPVPVAGPYPHNQFEQQAMLSMGGLGAAAMAASTGMSEFVELKKKAEMSDHYKGQYEFFKKKYDEVDIENRKLNAKIEIAEKEKEIAITSTKLDAKSWTDPETLKTVLQSLSPVLSAALNRGNQAASGQIGIGSTEGLSEAKQRFIGYLTDPDMADETVILLEATLAMLAHKPEFQVALTTLIEKNRENAPTGS